MNQVLKNPTMRKNVMTKVGNLLQKEMMKACSAQNKSLFKDKSVSAIEQFHWSNASNELKRVAPSLFALLNTCIPEKKHYQSGDWCRCLCWNFTEILQ